MNGKTSELPAQKKRGRDLLWFIALGLLCTSQLVTLYLLYKSNQKAESLVVVYDDNPRTEYLVKRHDLLQAIEKYGFLKGGAFALARIVRCHPWNAGGIDPVP